MEHNIPSVKSNPAKHLIDNIDHSFTWKVTCNAPNRKLVRKILEAYFTILLFYYDYFFYSHQKRVFAKSYLQK